MKIHFIGIGGIGVSALAQYYLAKGGEVSGSDLVSSEITDYLKKLGAKVFIMRHSAKNLPKDVNLVIYSPAVKRDNPELKRARRLQVTGYKLRVLGYPEALGELTKKYFTVAVCGTHGKSTTSAMIALILIKAGLNPTVVLGTKLKEFRNSNFHLGGVPNFKARKIIREGVQNSKILIIEADEHFASFLNYWPKIIVLTNIEADHLDYYKNLKNYSNSFKKFISHLPKNGVLVANKDDKNIQKLIFNFHPLKAGFNKFSIFNFQYSKSKNIQTLKKILKVPGKHNIYNALAALALARSLKIPDKISFKALSDYKGAWRRFEVQKGAINRKKFTIVSDYAHHPTEIRATLKAARERFPKKKIWCIFQPHQYQRTFYLFDDFVKVFSESLSIDRKISLIDKLIITDIYDVAGREERKIKKKVSSKKLIKKINRSSAIYLPKEKIKNYLRKSLRGREAAIIMGAGDIYDLSTDLLDINK